MANLITAPFTGGGAFPVDERLQKTKSEMLNTNDNVMPDVYLCVCKDDKQFYLYDKENDTDPSTGKYRVFKASSDGAIWKPTVDSSGNISWEKSESETPPTSRNIMGPPGPAGAGQEDIVDGQWTIKKYSDGSYEAWYAYWDLEYAIDVQEGAIFRSENISLPFPSSLNPQNKKNSVHFGGAMVRNPNFDCWGAYNGQSHMACMFKIYSSQARAANNRYIVNIYVKGKIG